MTKYHQLIICLLVFVVSSCSFGKKIQNGEMAFERKQYSVAVDMLKSEYEKSSNQRTKGRTAYLLGESYKYLEEGSLSVDWLAKAVNLEYGNDATTALAKAYKKQGNYQKAIETYELLKRNSNSKRQIDREIYVIKEVSKWESDTQEGMTINLISENTGYSEYSPAMLDQNYVVFTSDRSESTGGDKYNWTGNKHTDLFVMLKNGSDIKRFDAGINTKDNEGTAAFTKDGMEMVFTRCTSTGEADAYCKLMYSDRFSGIWSEPRALPIMVDNVNYGHPTFIEGDSVLVFSAKIESGTGGHDLYYSERVPREDGSFDWGEAYLFPQTINSIGNEMFPVGDGDTLYFSSDYFAGLGGLDIFKTWLQPNGQWAPPQNLKRPVNSSYDDFGFVVDRNANFRGSVIKKGFFTSVRGGYGKEDLYRFEQKRVFKEETDDQVPVEELVSIDLYLAGKTKEVEFADPNDPNSGRVGKSDLADCYITIYDGDEEQNIYSDENGQFIVQLVKDKDYRIKASKIGYLNDFVNVSTKDLKLKKGELSKTINVELVLNKIFSNMEIRLENIYYNFNKSDIRDDAKPTLDSLSQLLINNPQIEVQLSSHTDCRGDEQYNQILSQKRAESAINYIASKGVDFRRLTAVGFGKSALADLCNCDDCTEEQHQVNRRTTFKILE